MTGKMTIALLKREAELYRSQGLHREAIGAYQKILEIGSPLDPEVRQAVRGRLQVLSQELAALDAGPGDAIATQEVDLIQSDLDAAGDRCDAHNCARAFREIGLQIDPGSPGCRQRLDGLGGRGGLRLAPGARRLRSSFARVLENGAFGGLARRLRLLPAALANRLRAKGKGYSAARN